MINVSNLTKEYSGHKALDNVSFKIKKGEIVGLLGPNGAGKTTTMRIMTGFLPMTDGSVVIDGVDVYEDSLKARESLGYLPESTPLYPQMKVKEYLAFIADLKHLSKEEKKKQIPEVAVKCGLEDKMSVLIKFLSKGYKQRVGIAQALLGDPKLVILDEPTIGLDPNQIVEIRKLIKELGKTKTIILSTHILQEVSAVCTKVIIMNEGTVVAVDTPENLTKGATGVQFTISVKGPASDVFECISGLEKVERVIEVSNKEGVATFKVNAKNKQDPREVISNAVVKNGWSLLEMRKEEVDLEHIFMKMTKDAKKDQKAEKKKK